MTDLFARPGVIAQSWYLVGRSRALRRGGVLPFQLGDRRLAVFRDATDRVHAVDARCPHLGADLSAGAVCDEGLRCPFHGWTFAGDGRCRRAPGYDVPPDRRTRSYPTTEQWGWIWIFNGPDPAFALPVPDEPGEWRVWALPAQRLRCHPHVVLANGLDLTHYETLHGLTFTRPPRLVTAERHRVTVEMCGRPAAAAWRLISGTVRQDLSARFTTYGASLAWASVQAPVSFHVIFTARPDRHDDCVTRTLFLLPRRHRLAWPRAVGLMMMLLREDRHILDQLEFRPAFAERDEPLKAFAAAVNALGIW